MTHQQDSVPAPGQPAGGPKQPLDGIKVIDFTQVFLGPSATQLLADHGAEVIKIERPGVGELMRLEDFFRPEEGGENAMFVALNRNKKSLALNFSKPEGRDVVLKLIADADVLVHNFRPGVMARRGLEYEDLRGLNPGLIYAVGSGYGPTGPLAELPGQDTLAQAMSGVMMRKSEPDIPVHPHATTYADYGAGMHLVIAILLALRARDLNGVGQRVDVSLYNSLLGLQMQEAGVRLMLDRELNWAQSPLSAAFETTTGAVAIVGAFRENPLRDICLAIGLDDLSQDERFDSYEKMVERRAELHDILAERLRQGSTDQWVDALREVDILVAPVRTMEEALAEPQTRHNGMIVEFEQDGRKVEAIASPITMSGTPPDEPRAAPALGRDRDEILAAAGYSAEQIAELEEAGVLG